MVFAFIFFKISIECIYFEICYNSRVIIILQHIYNILRIQSALKNQLLHCCSVIQKRAWIEKEGEKLKDETLKMIQQMFGGDDRLVSMDLCNLIFERN